MSRPLRLLLALALAAAPPAAAQETGPLVRYGKWLLAAGAVTMNVVAAKEHGRADDAFHALERRCFQDASRCRLGSDGRYLDPASEELYQTTLRKDRSARRWLIGGETALLGAAALFVWEMTRKTHKPDNIPFEPEIRALNEATGIGLRVGW